MDTFYKAIRLDGTSHYDQATKWRIGKILRHPSPDPVSVGDCGEGFHCSRNLLDAVGYQRGPSLYLLVDPIDIIKEGKDKVRSASVKPLRYLTPQEVDELAGFKLWEANHPVNPFLLEAKPMDDLEVKVRKWDSVKDSVGTSVRGSVWGSVRDSVWGSVWNSVWNSVWDSVWGSVWDSVGDSVRDSVWNSVRGSVRDSVRDSVWAYIGGLFPQIKSWKYAQSLGECPWQSLLDLWYAGYIPSTDGKYWYVLAGPKAKIVAKYFV